MIPELNTSTWSHGTDKGVAFTVKHESEVLITPEILLKCIKADTCSNILTALLNEIAAAYDNHNGYFATGFSLNELTDEAKEYFKNLGQSIEELKK